MRRIAVREGIRQGLLQSGQRLWVMLVKKTVTGTINCNCVMGVFTPSMPIKTWADS